MQVNHPKNSLWRIHDRPLPRERMLMRMPANFWASRVLLFSTLFLLVVVHASGQASPPAPAKNAQSASATAAPAPSPADSKYVGTHTCKTCHEDIYNAWQKTAHWKTTLNKEPSHQ